METVKELFDATRTQFPELAEKTDNLHKQRYVDDELELNFLWFECLADVLNAEMTAHIPYENYANFFNFISDQLTESGREIYECIDVALVENLFFDVNAKHAKLYWDKLSKPIKELYLGFHGQPPL
ncbi:DUF7674 family protein [Noviherbaspirillum sp. ST9]|uniref:DUF7674 family protein n=1 Tax=Noviherbaspirillum sp. ST9 TaxID=3401606 RepID=UPI003B5895F1